MKESIKSEMYNTVGETYLWLPTTRRDWHILVYLFTGFSLQDFYLSYNSV